MIEKIFILHHTHVDFGYTGPREKVNQDLVAMVDQAIDLIDRSMYRPESERLRWIHEVSWPVLEYLRQGGRQKEILFDQLRQGYQELTGFYVNPTDLFDRDSFEISTDYACTLALENDLPLTTAMFSDCPGISWCIPDLLAERGIKYLSAAPDFIMSYPLEVERPFYWEGPAGNRVLTWFTEWRNFWYAEGLFALKLTESPEEAIKRLMDYVTQIEKEGYRWRGLAIHVAMDNAPPAPSLMDFVSRFNGSQSSVQARLAINKDFFEFMEKEHGSEFQVHRAAWPDWWANGNGSAAYEVACSRQTKASLRKSMAAVRQFNLKYNPELFRSAMEDMLLFDEHTWGHSTSAITPWATAARLQWAQKRSYAMKGFTTARDMENQIATQIGETGKIVLANPFETKWVGVVGLKGNDKGYPQAPLLKDIETQERIVGQRVERPDLEKQTWDYYCLSVPRTEKRRFELVKVTTLPPIKWAGLENDQFQIDYDSQTGKITGIWDRVHQFQLCDKSAQWSFGEVIHECVPHGSREALYDIKIGSNHPEAKRLRPQFERRGGDQSEQSSTLLAGAVFNSLLTSGQLPGVTFAREIRLYHALHRIDIILRINKQVDTNYESLYLAFPFSVTPPEVWLENAGTVYRAGADQLPGSATDWHSVDQYAAISDPGKTIVLVAHDTPLVQIGDLHTGKWAKRLEISCGHVFSWIMNNIWFTNFPAYQEGMVELTWSLTAQTGRFDRTAVENFAGATRVGVIVAAAGQGDNSIVW
ncbi:MAG: hypothetical protein WC975_00800 [Phycisphaerae bacterium]